MRSKRLLELDSRLEGLTLRYVESHYGLTPAEIETLQQLKRAMIHREAIMPLTEALEMLAKLLDDHTQAHDAAWGVLESCGLDPLAVSQAHEAALKELTPETMPRNIDELLAFDRRVYERAMEVGQETALKRKDREYVKP